MLTMLFELDKSSHRGTSRCVDKHFANSLRKEDGKTVDANVQLGIIDKYISLIKS